MADFVEIAVNTTDAVLAPLVKTLAGYGDGNDDDNAEKFTEEDLEFGGAAEVEAINMETFERRVDSLVAGKLKRLLTSFVLNGAEPPAVSLEDCSTRIEDFSTFLYYLTSCNKNVKALSLEKCQLTAEHAKALGWAIPRMGALRTLKVLDSHKVKSIGTAALVVGLLAEDQVSAVTITECSVRDPAGYLGRLVRESQALRRLDVSSNKIGPTGAAQIGAALAENINLEDLDMHNNRVGDGGCSAVTNALKQNIVLRDLFLGDNKLTMQAGPAIGEMLAKNHSLRNLELQKNDLGNEGTAAISDGLAVNRDLQSLRLNMNGIGEAGMRSITAALRKNSTLLNLYLQDNLIDDGSFVEFTEVLAGNTGLQVLDVSRNKLDDRAAVALGSALSANSTLTEAIFDGNGFADSGCSAIATGLQGNTTLVKLSLCRNAVGNAGASALGYLLANAGNTTLKHLELDENPISAKAEEGWLRAANLRGMTGPSQLLLNISMEGTEIASNSLKTFGVKINNAETKTSFSVGMLVLSILTNWFDLATDALVAWEFYSSAFNPVPGQSAISPAWFIMSLIFLCVPTFYMMVFMSSPSSKQEDTLTVRAQNALLSLFQVRLIYEAYQSYKYHETTTRYASIRVVEVAGESGPQSFLQINFIIFYLARADANINVSSTAVITSVALSLLVLGQTFSDLFERQYVFRHTKHTEGYQIFLRLLPCWLFHICQFASRALTIAIIITIFKAYIASLLVVGAIALRFVIWYATGSERSPVFAFLVTFLANSAWDKRVAVLFGISATTLEACGVIAALWLAPPDGTESWLYNPSASVADLDPLTMTVLMGSLWLIYATIFATWIYPKHEYSNLRDIALETEMVVPDEVPSEMLNEDERSNSKWREDDLPARGPATFFTV